MGVKESVPGLASVSASESLQSSVSLQVMMNLSWKALPLSPLEPDWMPPYMRLVVASSSASK